MAHLVGLVETTEMGIACSQETVSKRYGGSFLDGEFELADRGVEATCEEMRDPH
jgi:hypothetical protein